MSGSIRNFVIQTVVTLALATIAGAALFGFADYATSGVIA